MDSEDSRKIISLLEEIRDSQRLMIERQAQALARQEEVISMQRERQADLTKQVGLADQLMAQADQLQARSIRNASRAFLTLFVVVFLAILLVVIVCWLAFSRAA